MVKESWKDEADNIEHNYFYWTIKDFKKGNKINPRNNGTVKKSFKRTKFSEEGTYGWGPKDFKEYYDKNFPGKRRSEVFKLDSGFYRAVFGKGYEKEVFPAKLPPRISAKMKKEKLEAITI